MLFYCRYQPSLYYVSCTAGGLIGGADILLFTALALYGQVFHYIVRLMGKLKTISFMAPLILFTLVDFLPGAGQLRLFIAVAGRRLRSDLAVLFQDGFEL